MRKVEKVGIFLQKKGDRSVELTRQIIPPLQNEGATPNLLAEDAHTFGFDNLALDLDDFMKNDLIIVLGGDGTFLDIARRTAGSGVPLLGVNLGRIGFLSGIESDEIIDKIPSLIKGSFTIEERMMAEALFEDGTRELALNEVVVGKGADQRMVHLATEVDGVSFLEYVADGIMVSTPTGSTAYALSAGGPIVDPSNDLLLVVPICPHSFTSRPMVFSPHSQIRIVSTDPDRTALVTIDGRIKGRIKPGSSINVSKAAEKVSLARPTGHSFLEILAQKFSLRSTR